MRKPKYPHVAKALQYVNQVLAGVVHPGTDRERMVGKYERLAIERHARDIARQADKSWPYRFDAQLAERQCKLASRLPHVKGKWAVKDPKTGLRQTLDLEGWQCFLYASLFGWVKKSTSKRRFLTASWYIPRKNSKSTTACGVGWWMFGKDNEPGAEVYCGATSEKQAWEVFGPARKMAEFEPELADGLGVTINARSMVIEESNSKFEPIIGNPGDGASPHCAIVDEYHEHKTSALHDTMKTGMGAREQPLMLKISTAGENLEGPCLEDWRDCEKLLEGVIEDETHFAIIFTIDDGDDWTTEAALRKANPNWGVSVNPEVILPDQARAARDATKQAAFKTKHLNMWVSAAKAWLNMQTWKACADGKLSMDEFAGADCWVSLDAASKIDMTSLVAVFRRNGGYAVFAKHFLPQDTINLPENQQYRKWHAAGALIATPGARIDFTVIEDVLKDWSTRFAIQEFAYDPRELNDFVNRVSVWASFPRIEVTQGPNMMSEPMKELEAQVEAKTLVHADDQILNWMASNVVKKEARGGGPVKYYYPTKQSAAKKIDGIVAAIMAIGRAMTSSGPTGIGFAVANNK